MATFTESEIRAAAQRRRSYRTAEAKLNEEVASQNSQPSTARYDVFLSHSTRDADIVLGVKAVLEGQGKRVYVDWIDDRQLDRTNVTPATAALLRARMRQSNSLLYIHSTNASSSRWMPWELGYSDGLHGAVAIFPVTQAREDEFRGQEFLGIYPYIDHDGVTQQLRVKRSRFDTRTWTNWVADPRGFAKAA